MLAVPRVALEPKDTTLIMAVIEMGLDAAFPELESGARKGRI